MIIHHTFIKHSYDNGRISRTKFPSFSTIYINPRYSRYYLVTLVILVFILKNRTIILTDRKSVV